MYLARTFRIKILLLVYFIEVLSVQIENYFFRIIVIIL